MLILFRLLEESYVLKDPFSPDKDKFIILGSSCTLCGKVVCVGTVGYALRACTVGSGDNATFCF